MRLVRGHVQRFKRVEAIVFLPGGDQRGQQRADETASLAAAIEVADGVLQDALEDQRQFRRRGVRIAIRQFHHRVLHDIQCAVFILDRIPRLLESAFLRRLQKVGHFLAASHRMRV